jgi:hypothetical protein
MAKLRQPKDDVDHAKTRYAAPDEIIQEHASKGERVGQQHVVFPKSGPRDEHEEETDLEAEKNEGHSDNAVHEISYKVLTVAVPSFARAVAGGATPLLSWSREGECGSCFQFIHTLSTPLP